MARGIEPGMPIQVDVAFTQRFDQPLDLRGVELAGDEDIRGARVEVGAGRGRSRPSARTRGRGHLS